MLSLPSVLLQIGWRSTGPYCLSLTLRHRAAMQSPNPPPLPAPLPPPLSPPPLSPPFSDVSPPFRTPFPLAGRLLLLSTCLWQRWTCWRPGLCLKLVTSICPCQLLFYDALSSLSVLVLWYTCPPIHCCPFLILRRSPTPDV